MNDKKWKIKFAGILVVLSVVLYFIHYLIFKDLHHMFIFMVEDIAFIPIEVLMVSLIFHKILDEREKEHILEKLNMLIGLFFSEVGTELLRVFVVNSPNTVEDMFKDIENWDEKDFKNKANLTQKYKTNIDIEKIHIEELAEFLKSKRNFLIGLLQNPSLLEHETFTELLRTVFHVEDELHHHIKYDNLTEKDINHLNKDMERVYPLLVYEWIVYMKYIKNNHPYLFSLAVRDNPFN